MTTAMRRWETRAARGASMSGRALLLVTLGVLAMTTTVADAQPRTRGRVIIETHHTDLAGNIRLSTNEAGDVTQHLDYAPFGEVDGRSCTGDGDPTRSPQFQGTLRDPKTCLDDFGARDDYMITGRFPSVDPVLPVETALRDPQQWNRYAYARNHPLIYTDPDGRLPDILWDAWNVSSGVTSFVSNVAAGNYISAAVDAVGVVLDVAETAVPGVPGGASSAIKGYRVANAADNVIDAVRVADDVADAAKAIDSGVSAATGTTGLGKFAGESIPARSSGRNFTAAERAEVNAIGARTGCQTCGTTNLGTRSGNFVPDHQPPSALNATGEPQRLYPQCIGCSREQGLEIARQLRRGEKP